MRIKNTWSALGSRLFPIYKDELHTFLPMAFMFILLSFCYALTRSLKDMFFMNDASVEAIYWIKGVATTPTMVLFAILYGKVSQSTNRDGRFNIVMIYFLAFFTLAYFFLFPQKEILQPVNFANQLILQYPKVKGLWQALCYWPDALFYIHAEAWAAFVITVLFWTFVNEITAEKQTKRFYSFLSMFGSIGSIVGGLVLRLKSVKENFNYGLLFIIGAILVLLFVYNYFTAKIRANPRYYQIETKSHSEKLKISFKESIKRLAQSKYLMLIATLVISYGLVIALFESIQKDLMEHYVKHEKSMLADLYARQQITVGITSILITFGLATSVLKRSWRFTASITPITTLVMTVIFFGFLQFSKVFDTLFQSYFNATLLHLSVMIGIYNVVLIKAAKYILFDPSKEAAYLPLDENSKIYGKATVDGIGSRLGKNLASVLITSMTVLFGNGEISKIYTPIFCFIIVTAVVWLMAVHALSKLKTITEAKNKTKFSKVNAATTLHVQNNC